MSDYAAEHKVPKYMIRELRNTDPTFYPLLGPLLSRREVVAELGGPVWDEDSKRWQVAVSETGEVLGMVARHRREVCSLYVVPGSRGQLVGTALLHAACRDRGDLRATATDASLPLFEMFGFVETGQKGRFHKMKRDAHV